MRPITVLVGAALAIALAPAAHAVRSVELQARTAGQLAALCTANPNQALGDARVDFCHGFAQGAVDVELRHARPFCFPHPTPSRTETLREFARWVQADPTRANEPATEGLFRFLAERYPCNK